MSTGSSTSNAEILPLEKITGRHSIALLIIGGAATVVAVVLVVLPQLIALPVYFPLLAIVPGSVAIGCLVGLILSLYWGQSGEGGNKPQDQTPFPNHVSLINQQNVDNSIPTQIGANPFLGEKVPALPKPPLPQVRFTLKPMPLEKRTEEILVGLSLNEANPENFQIDLTELEGWAFSIFSTIPFDEDKAETLSPYVQEMKEHLSNLKKSWMATYGDLVEILHQEGQTERRKSLVKQLNGMVRGKKEWAKCSLLHVFGLAKRAQEALDYSKSLPNSSPPLFDQLLPLGDMLWHQKENWGDFLKSLEVQPDSVQREFLLLIDQARAQGILSGYLNLILLPRLKDYVNKTKNIESEKKHFHTFSTLLRGLKKPLADHSLFYQTTAAIQNLHLKQGILRRRKGEIKNEGSDLLFRYKLKLPKSQAEFTLKWSDKTPTQCVLSLNCVRGESERFWLDWESYIRSLSAQERLLLEENSLHASATTLQFAWVLEMEDTERLQWALRELEALFENIEERYCRAGIHRMEEIGRQIFSKETLNGLLFPEMHWSDSGVVAAYMKTEEGIGAYHALRKYGDAETLEEREKECTHVQILSERITYLSGYEYANLSGALEEARLNLRSKISNQIVFEKDEKGFTCFRRAVNAQDLKLARRELQKGAYVDSLDYKGYRALHTILEQQNRDLLQLCIKYHTDLSQPFGKERYPVLFWAIDCYQPGSSNSRALLKDLLDAGIDLNVSYKKKSLDTYLNEKRNDEIIALVRKCRDERARASLNAEEFLSFKEHLIIKNGRGSHVSIQMRRNTYYIWFDCLKDAICIQSKKDMVADQGTPSPKQGLARRHHALAIKLDPTGKVVSTCYDEQEIGEGDPRAYQFLIPMYRAFVEAYRGYTHYDSIHDHPGRFHIEIPKYRLQDDSLVRLRRVGMRVLIGLAAVNQPKMCVRHLEWVKDAGWSLAQGQDAGGLSRGYLSNLIEGLIHHSPLHFGKNSRSQLFMPLTTRPCLPGRNIPSLKHNYNKDISSEKSTYEFLGFLFYFCFNSYSPTNKFGCNESYAIGKYFDEAFFAGILCLDTQDFLCKDSSLETQLKMARTLLEAYGDFDRYQGIFDCLNLLSTHTHDQISEKDLLEAAMQAHHAETLPNEYLSDRGSPDTKRLLEAKREDLRQVLIQALMRAIFEAPVSGGALGRQLAPILQTARGLWMAMTNHKHNYDPGVWHQWKSQLTASKLSDAVQGSLDRKRIIDSIRLDPTTSQEDAPHLKRQIGWLKEWLADPVRGASDEEVRGFLRFVSDTPALLDNIIITIKAQKLGNPVAYPRTSTCKFTLSLAAAPCRTLGFSNDTKDRFLEGLRFAMEEGVGYSEA